MEIETPPQQKDMERKEPPEKDAASLAQRGGSLVGGVVGAAYRHYSHTTFGHALAELLRERQGDPWRANLKDFARELGIPYSTLRNAAMGRTQPPLELLEKVAARIGIPPSFFREYRVLKIAEAIEQNPELAGTIYDFVLEQLGDSPQEEGR